MNEVNNQYTSKCANMASGVVSYSTVHCAQHIREGDESFESPPCEQGGAQTINMFESTKWPKSFPSLLILPIHLVSSSLSLAYPMHF